MPLALDPQVPDPAGCYSCEPFRDATSTPCSWRFPAPRAKTAGRGHIFRILAPKPPPPAAAGPRRRGSPEPATGCMLPPPTAIASKAAQVVLYGPVALQITPAAHPAVA